LFVGRAPEIQFRGGDSVMTGKDLRAADVPAGPQFRKQGEVGKDF